MAEDQFDHLPADVRAVVAAHSETIKRIAERYHQDSGLGGRPMTPSQMDAVERAFRQEIAPLQKAVVDILSYYPSRPLVVTNEEAARMGLRPLTFSPPRPRQPPSGTPAQPRRG